MFQFDQNTCFLRFGPFCWSRTRKLSVTLYDPNAKQNTNPKIIWEKHRMRHAHETKIHFDYQRDFIVQFYRMMFEKAQSFRSENAIEGFGWPIKSRSTKPHVECLKKRIKECLRKISFFIFLSDIQQIFCVLSRVLRNTIKREINLSDERIFRSTILAKTLRSDRILMKRRKISSPFLNIMGKYRRCKVQRGDEFMPIIRLFEGIYRSIFIENEIFSNEIKFFCPRTVRKFSYEKRVDESVVLRNNNKNYCKVQFLLWTLPGPFSKPKSHCYKTLPFNRHKSKRRKKNRLVNRARCKQKRQKRVMNSCEKVKPTNEVELGLSCGCERRKKKFTVAHRDSRMIIIGFSRTFYIKMH